MAMTVDLPLDETRPVTAKPAAARWGRYARPALGLLLPVGMALVWELIVWLGYTFVPEVRELVQSLPFVWDSVRELTRNP